MGTKNEKFFLFFHIIKHYNMDLMKKKVHELKQMCKDRKISGFSTKKKCDLVKMLTGQWKDIPVCFTHEECDRSATEWFGKESSPARLWFYNAVKDPKQHRDIGKVLAYFAEEYVKTYIIMKTGRSIISVYGESYDGITTDEKRKIRHQVKFRSGSWHLETTRRNSIKNQDTNKTGHIAYRSDEFDVLVIFIPGPAFGITGSSIRFIPITDLINPQKPNQLITNADKLKNKFNNDTTTEAIIQELYMS